MNLVFKNGSVFQNGAFHEAGIFVSDGVFVSQTGIPVSEYDCSSYFLFPGLVDVHVHLREPGFFYKETIRTGTLAAAHGGYTTICSMPNLSPAPDTAEHLEEQLAIIRRDAAVQVLPYGAITQGEQGRQLSDMEAMAPYVVGFSDDGKGVQDADMMRAAMKKAKALGKPIVAHCEDERLLRGGYIHDGAYARAHGHRGICSESEWGQIKRDLALVRETGCAYHICHISTKESVALIRQAKRDGLDVTCETAPHYLLLDDSMLQEDGRFKMNPPIRDKSDREALLEGLCDGTIDMIATDHAPHSAEEKSRGLEKSLMGIVGLETAFPLLYTYLVRPGILSLEKLMVLMHDAPCRRFGIHRHLEAGHAADLTVFDLNRESVIDPESFLSMGHSTPFAGYPVAGACLMTVANGKIVWDDGTLKTKI
jgi:dihydroorotase